MKKRVIFAIICALISLVAIAYLVIINIPNISFQIVAASANIDAKFPSFIPKNFKATEIKTENNAIIINFKNSTEEAEFTLTEEETSWNSNSLLVNYITPNFAEDYSIIKEQGLTIYTDDTQSAWINGNILFKITIISGELNKSQIKSIATSL